MKTMLNLTTCREDLDRFPDAGALSSILDGFDGVELMCLGEDERHIIQSGQVIGLHMNCFPYWLDFWNGDISALISEFDTSHNCERCYGGMDRSALIRHYERDLALAHAYNAEYVVFHVSDSSARESFTWNYRHSSEEVIDAACELLNILFKNEDGSVMLLLENLWQPGLTMTTPDMTKRLLDGVAYRNKGIMLDTGHLLHTNTAIRTQEEGLEYIGRMLDTHGSLCDNIRGIHLNQSLTGEYCERTISKPPKLGDTYAQRCEQMFWHAFTVDQHLPFTCEEIDKLIARVAPQYLTYEFITTDSEQHRMFIEAQRLALAGLEL